MLAKKRGSLRPPSVASQRACTGDQIDRKLYPKGVVVTDEQMATVHLQSHRFHGEWNYTIRPVRSKR